MIFKLADAYDLLKFIYDAYQRNEANHHREFTLTINGPFHQALRKFFQEAEKPKP